MSIETTMPLSVRLSGEAEEALEAWVDSGVFKSKAEAIRRSLDLMLTVIEAKEKGHHVLAVPPEVLDEMRVVQEIA